MARVLLNFLAPLTSLAVSVAAHAIPPAPFDRLVEQLNSDDYHARIQATDDIASATSGVTLKQIEAQLKLPTITLEQRTRLLLAGEQIFMRSPRAAIGLEWLDQGGLTPGRGVTISRCIDGFDSVRTLRPGDIVRALDGAPVENAGFRELDIKYEIVSRDPGDELRLSIIRNGEPIQVVCRVGKFTDLPRSRSMDMQVVLDGAWKKRLARMTALAPAKQTLRPPLLENGWHQAEAETSKATHDDAIANDHIARALGLDPHTVDVSVVIPMARIGGEARGEPTNGSPDFDLPRDRGPVGPINEWRKGRRRGAV